MSKKPIDWENDNQEVGQIVSETISPPIRSRKVEENPIDIIPTGTEMEI